MNSIQSNLVLICGLSVLLAGCGQDLSSTDSASKDKAGTNPPVVGQRIASCDNFLKEPFLTRNDLVGGTRRDNAQMLLRFVQLTDDHIIDDEAQAINGASLTDPLHPTFEAAMRLQQEYSDEALNSLIAGVNACQQKFPSEFAIITGDSADLTTLSETRRFIDNLDGTFDQVSDFETKCLAGLPAGTPAPLAEQQCKRFTGRGVADTQSEDPDLDNPAYQSLYTRTVLQSAMAQAASSSGRAADGSTDPTRQTMTRAAGLPEVLRCKAGAAGCSNVKLAMPWMVAFGNHDGYLRGTLAFNINVANAGLTAAGRHYLSNQHEFIDEFFVTEAVPGPVGHGFNYAEMSRRIDADLRNDGHYAFDAGSGKFRMIVLNTIIDGYDSRIPGNLLLNPFALSDGSIDTAQFDWMKAELAASAARGQLALVFSHHPDLTFADRGMFAALVPIEVTAAQMDAELASWPHLIAWVAGHTHIHRIRAFKVTGGVGSNGVVETPVTCKIAGACAGFWQIETASLIDDPQQQRLIEILDNHDGSGTIRTPVLMHTFETSKKLAERDDRCSLYLSDPQAAASAMSDAGMGALCALGGTRSGEAKDRNVDLMFKMPAL